MKNTCILFNGGGYGTFVEWCLNYFSDPTMSDQLPFNLNGNAHKFNGNPKGDFQMCLSYINSSDDLPIVRFHPKHTIDESLIDNLNYINSHFRHVIYLYPTIDSIAWNINNKFEKIFSHGWLVENEDIIYKDLKKCNIESIDTAEPWQLREFLSFFLYPQHLAESETLMIDSYAKQFSNFKFVSMNQLRDNFKQTIIMLLDYCKLTPTRISQIEYIYNSWIKLQYHCHKDQLIKQIVSAVLTNTDFTWPSLTLVDESLIQHYLREQHIGIKCFNLNVFPSSTQELKQYLYTM
jgi:hypothetical protein